MGFAFGEIYCQYIHAYRCIACICMNNIADSDKLMLLLSAVYITDNHFHIHCLLKITKPVQFSFSLGGWGWVRSDFAVVKDLMGWESSHTPVIPQLLTCTKFAAVCYYLSITWDCAGCLASLSG